jgi:S1-C subfamily serine protease
VLTNHHVIEDAESIEVALDDGTKYAAALVGKDPHTDLAVLKIQDAPGRDFVPIEPGDSDALRVGEFVIAIGSPFSLSSSVTLGIVSQKGRSLGALPYEDFIQSDAAVNPGNSGGPLVDIDGRMVGVNTMITASPHSPGSIGISFAVPANVAMHVAQSIMRNGTWERPWLGIAMDQTPAGVTVEDVVPRSPADRAGVAVGDRLVRVDNQAVNSGRDVQRAVLRRDVGDTIAVEVERGGKAVKLQVTTEAMPPPPMYFRE